MRNAADGSERTENADTYYINMFVNDWFTGNVKNYKLTANGKAVKWQYTKAELAKNPANDQEIKAGRKVVGYCDAKYMPEFRNLLKEMDATIQTLLTQP